MSHLRHIIWVTGHQLASYISGFVMLEFLLLTRRIYLHSEGLYKGNKCLKKCLFVQIL